ncbi:MAG: hypothetical protein A2Y24_00310 [Clostridiales bacterium GWE2_32_10]|nr:MAG: hypothetical protein A2Y24_00310 [Clostridiales bacterium GWE2_32_10]
MEEVKEIHQIYCEQIPEFIYELLDSEQLIRLNGISQHCGMDYTKTPVFRFNYFYSRLDHSLGVALILWHFTKDKKQTIAGFLHDIASPTFAHAVDYMKKDYMHQEATEDLTNYIIKKDLMIMNKLKGYDIALKEVNDYKIYPLADNKTPRICADRLECTLHYPHLRGKMKIQDIKKIYNDICILKNEDGEEEFGFANINTAIEITKIGIDNGILDSSNENRLFMQLLADIVDKSIELNIITEEDLYIKSENEIISLLKNCGIKVIQDAWNSFSNTEEVYVSREPIYNKYNVNMQVKKRYIDPLIKTATGIYRVSEISKEMSREMEKFKANNSQDYIFIDFKF